MEYKRATWDVRIKFFTKNRCDFCDGNPRSIGASQQKAEKVEEVAHKRKSVTRFWKPRSCGWKIKPSANAFEAERNTAPSHPRDTVMACAHGGIPASRASSLTLYWTSYSKRLSGAQPSTTGLEAVVVVSLLHGYCVDTLPFLFSIIICLSERCNSAAF